nr:PREDICTED: Fc receptor-like protein 5 [Anolis carolinensis]|eukprot:XP_016852477.1 PREDICTED: Fc receptor-like protein 5 [Anolis carolinensis]
MGTFTGTWVSASLPAPTLSLSPPFSTFFRGELVRLDCKAPAGQTGSRFFFSRMNRRHQWIKYKDQGTHSLQIATTHLKPKEFFACIYKAEDNRGRSFESQRSRGVFFSIIECPRAPVLSPNSQPSFYIVGEEVTLNCAAPEGQDVAGYRFFQEKQDQQLLFFEGQKPHKDLHVDGNVTGQFSCRYWILTSEGRQIQSLESNSVPIIVRAHPPTPELKIDPPSGVLLEGEILLITCLSDGNQTEKSFHFFKDGVEIGTTNQGSLNCSKGPGGASSNISLSICLQAQPNQTGEYTCRYEENMSGRWILSPWSQKVNITVPFAVLYLLGPFAGSQGEASLPAPTLSLFTPFSTFSNEEWIFLDCKSPAGQTGSWFSFSRMNRSNQWTIYKEQIRKSLEIPATDLESKETFICFYKTKDNKGRSFQSPRSNSIVISIIKPPRGPVLSLDPQQPFYIPGEELSLDCAAPEGQDVAGYRFLREGQTQKSKQLFLEGKEPRQAFQVDENTNGTYVCVYWILTAEGREIQSQKSNTVSIVVRDLPPTPDLKMDPASGMILAGDTMRITCSSNGNHMERKFYFYKDGAEIGATNQRPLDCSKEPGDASSNISLSICLQAQPNLTGEYTCRYKKSMSGRWIMSHWSQKVNITVSSPVSEFPVHALFAVPFIILLMIPIAFCFRRKICASTSYQECDPGENKKNKKERQKPKSETSRDQDLQDSEVAYAQLAFLPAPPRSGPAMENTVSYTEKKGVMYSDIRIKKVKKEIDRKHLKPGMS